MPAPDQAAQGPARKILIVDDEQDVVDYLDMLFRDTGYETLIAGDGEAALEMLRSHKPDLVTLDISMPRASGTRFYRTVKNDPALSGVPVVIITAVTGYGGDPYGYEKFIRKSDAVPPPDGFFPKPIDRDQLLAAVEKLLSAAPAAS